jgi:hypothetical protein
MPCTTGKVSPGSVNEGDWGTAAISGRPFFFGRLAREPATSLSPVEIRRWLL